ncbi:MAG: hypothetical protein HUU16_10515 [Candidatus Omnitrophica bacterium]|nr:hypothetical protein [Candidatus Omnitrophota bacterium]
MICLQIAEASNPTETPTAVPSPSPEIAQIFRLIGEKRWDEALTRLGPLAAESPDDPQVLLFQVAIFQGMGRHPECHERAERYLQLYPTSQNRDQVLFLYASSLRQTGRKEEAVKRLEEAARITRDPTLKANIETILRMIANEGRIGIHLGGKAPRTAEERIRAAAVQRRILDRALADYRSVKGIYPDRLEQLQEENPPFLRSLPEDLEHPGETVPYRREGDGYVFPDRP